MSFGSDPFSLRPQPAQVPQGITPIERRPIDTPPAGTTPAIEPPPATPTSKPSDRVAVKPAELRDYDFSKQPVVFGDRSPSSPIPILSVDRLSLDDDLETEGLEDAGNLNLEHVLVSQGLRRASQHSSVEADAYMRSQGYDPNTIRQILQDQSRLLDPQSH